MTIANKERAMSRDSRGTVMHVKGMFPSQLLAELRQYFIDNESAQNSGAALSDRERRAVERGEGSDAFRMDPRWYDVWRELGAIGRHAIGVFTYVMFPVQLRHVREQFQNVPWHQDYGYMKLLGSRAPRQIITCFIPVERDPAKCTTLQFTSAGSGTEVAHSAARHFGAEAQVDQAGDMFHFDLSLGDALVFGDYVLHRTYTPVGKSIERRSLEFRLITPEDATPGRDFFDVGRKQFIKT